MFLCTCTPVLWLHACTNSSLSQEPVDQSFNLEVEIYCSQPADDSTGKVSTPIKMLKKLRHKVLILHISLSLVCDGMTTL